MSVAPLPAPLSLGTSITAIECFSGSVPSISSCSVGMASLM